MSKKTRSRAPAWVPHEKYALMLASGALELPVFLEQTARWLVDFARVDACVVFMSPPDSGNPRPLAGHGFQTAEAESLRLPAGLKLAERASRLSRVLSFDLSSAPLRRPAVAAGPDEADFSLAVGVPIEHVDARVGALVFYRRDPRRFERSELTTLRELGTRLDMAIALANQASDHARRIRLDAPPRHALAGMYRGEAVSHGQALGSARVLTRLPASHVLERRRVQEADGARTQDLAGVLAATVAQIQKEQLALADRLPEAATMLFESHLMILRDESFLSSIGEGHEAGMELGRAIAVAAEKFISILERSGHDYVRERARDIEDVALRLIRNVDAVARGDDDGKAIHIVVARELLPSDILWLAQRNVKGIVLVSGGSTAHVSLLVRSLGIPMVIVSDAQLLQIDDGTCMVVDGFGGIVLVNPPETAIRSFERRGDPAVGAQAGSRKMRPVTTTRDGCRIRLMANVNLLGEVPQALEMHAEGIGLYRTELLYLMRSDLPGELDQESVYRRLLQVAGELPVTFRTLDAGGDKVLSFFDSAAEANPALGLRSTRLTLKHPEIFDQQLRAILRASSERDEARIMFPMIGSLDEWRLARERFLLCSRQVMQERGQGHNVRLGMMVELPAVVELMEDLAGEVDFFSIGTNDFIQYTLGVDRTNGRVAEYYCPHHPAVLRGLQRVVTAACRRNVPISVCGEMAHDPRYIPFFIGIGVRELSVDPNFLPAVQEAAERFTLSEAVNYALSLLMQPTIGAVADRLIGA